MIEYKEDESPTFLHFLIPDAQIFPRILNSRNLSSIV